MYLHTLTEAGYGFMVLFYQIFMKERYVLDVVFLTLVSGKPNVFSWICMLQTSDMK